MKETIATEIGRLSNEIQPQLIADRRDVHRHPETGWTEYRTAALVAHRLDSLGFSVRMGRDVCAESARMGVPQDAVLESCEVRAKAEGADPAILDLMRGGFTGVTGDLRNGEGPTVGLRFDMDALPLTESADPSHRPAAEGFASIHEGICHACGHDGHVSAGLGMARILRSLKSEIHGTIRLIFQPAEEGVRGARSMVAAGVVDDVDFLLGHHLITGCALGEIVPGMGGYAATRKFDVSFHGAPAHAGGSPEGGHNALLAAATATLHLHALPRHHDGFTRINVGQISGGSGRNIIPAEAFLVVEVRGETTELCDAMYRRAMTVIEASAAMHGCTASVRAMGQAGTANSDPSLADRVRAAASRLPGTQYYDLEKMGGAEDFTEMMLRVQARGGEATNIGIGADLRGVRFQDQDRDRVLPAHTGIYDFDERALVFAANAMILTVYQIAAGA